MTCYIVTITFIFCMLHFDTIHASTFSPSSAIVCNNLSDQKECQRKILVTGFIDDSVDFELQFTLDEDTQIVDEDGRKWVPSSPVSVRLKRRNTRYIFGLTPAGSFHNAYQVQTLMPGLLLPPADTAIEKYCTRSQGIVKNELAYNATEYNSYDVENGVLHFNLDVQAIQGSTVKAVSLSQSKWSDSLPGIAAKITMEVSAPAIITGQRQVVEKSAEATNSQGFMVRSSFFSPSSITNSLGMSKEDWASAFTCSQNYGHLVKINNKMYDQMGSFRGNRLLDLLPDCTFDITRSAYSSTSSYPRLSYLCNGISTTVVVLELSAGASGFKLKKLFGVPFILDSGVLPFESTDIDAYLYVDIMNKGDSSGAFTVEATKCCVKPKKSIIDHNCDAFPLPEPASSTVEAISTARFKLLLPAHLVVNKTGFCDIRVTQHVREEIVSRVGIDTTKYYQSTEITDSDPCMRPYITYTHNGKQFCRPPCETKDQEFDPGSNTCVAVDCQSKYAGQRDFFNTVSNFCESVTVCPENEEYDPLVNRCKQVITQPDGEIFDEREYVESAQKNLNLVKTPSCGHGHLSEDKTSCICDPGWTTNVFRGEDGNTFCTTPDYSRNNGNEDNANDTITSSPFGNNGEDFLYGLLRLLTDMPSEMQIVVAIGGFLVVCLLLGGCGCVCFFGCQFTKHTKLSRAPLWAAKAALRYNKNSKAKKRHAPVTFSSQLANTIAKTKDIFLYGAQGLQDNSVEVPDYILMQQQYMFEMQRQYAEQMRSMYQFNDMDDSMGSFQSKMQAGRIVHRHALESGQDMNYEDTVKIVECDNEPAGDGNAASPNERAHSSSASRPMRKTKKPRMRPDVDISDAFA